MRFRNLPSFALIAFSFFKLPLLHLLSDTRTTKHGLMIDAGSSGSRMHVYEFDNRVLEGEKEISDAVSVSDVWKILLIIQLKSRIDITSNFLNGNVTKIQKG